ncbi:hypothetical protein Acy02nite_30430 [Actinoplanes cyaneus]|uniref:Uncharacterized protein n=1 Tax=Actinoplanes cyaneus TaxID=52696 RepID=A0A919IIU5_9ACTN|nr:hypothetical protein Acy02nite_30430 [Actinoplanes cyaneus]
MRWAAGIDSAAVTAPRAAAVTANHGTAAAIAAGNAVSTSNVQACAARERTAPQRIVNMPPPHPLGHSFTPARPKGTPRPSDRYPSDMDSATVRKPRLPVDESGVFDERAALRYRLQ